MTVIQEKILGFMTAMGQPLYRSRTRWGRVQSDHCGKYYRFGPDRLTQREFGRAYFKSKVIKPMRELGCIIWVEPVGGWVVLEDHGSFRAAGVT